MSVRRYSNFYSKNINFSVIIIKKNSLLEANQYIETDCDKQCFVAS